MICNMAGWNLNLISSYIARSRLLYLSTQFETSTLLSLSLRAYSYALYDILAQLEDIASHLVIFRLIALLRLIYTCLQSKLLVVSEDFIC